MKGYLNDAQLLTDLKNYIDKNGIPENRTKAFKSKNGLCSWETYQNHLGGKLSVWIEMCGVRLSDDEKFNLDNRGIKNMLSKEDCINIIMNMQSLLDRPLCYDDFRGSSVDHVGITQIKKHWGTVNKMKSELGLKITQESMLDRQIFSIKEFEEMCKNFNQYLIKHNIKSITTKSFDKIDGFMNYCSFDKYSNKFFGIPITKYLQNEFGIIFGNKGNGKTYDFADGEITVSQWEYDFSTFLRNNGFDYNESYFRNIRYNTIDDNYDGHMDCDYMICINDTIVYIELAGILNCKKYSDAFKYNIPLKSKSKELYRQKLNQKREIFERNNLEYYILFPDDMNEDNYKRILEKYMKKVA